MKLPIGCLYLVLLVPGVLGNVLAGPYQTVFLWYAYQIGQIAFEGTGNDFVGKFCRGTAPGGACYFDQFLRYIQDTEGPQWRGSTGIGVDLNPDYIYAAQQVSNSRYRGYFNANSLLVSKFQPGEGPNYTSMFSAVMDNVQAARKAVGDAKFGSLYPNAIRSWVAVVQSRFQDLAPYLISDVNAWLQSTNKAYKVITQSVTAIDGSKFNIIDTHSTIVQFANENDRFQQAFNKFLFNYGSSPGRVGESAGANGHVLLVQMSQKYQSLLQGPPPC